MAQPRIGLLAVGFSRLDQTVKLSTGRCAFGCVAEQPVLTPDNEGPDRTLGGVVVYALTRRMSSVGANPTRLLSLRPEALWSSSGGNEWAEVSEEKASFRKSVTVQAVARSEHRAGPENALR